MPVTIKLLPDGPIRVQGEVEIQDAQGNVIPGKGGDTVHLCRCGASANKPFCDGAHKKAGFKG